MFKILQCNNFKATPIVLKTTSIKQFSSGRTTLSAVLHAPKELKLEELPVPELQEHEVLVQVETCGICGSDMHFYNSGRLGNFLLKEPLVLGHESSGTVLESGKHVPDLKPGDKVAIEPQHGCRMCSFCKTGHYNICPNQWHAGFPPHNGNLSRYITVSYDICYKLPDNVNHDDGALIQPLSVTLHACKKAEVRGGDVVLILGAGTMGLMSLIAAKYFGASKILLVDVEEHKLCKAKSLGATKTLNCSNMSEQEQVAKIKELLGTLPNISIDCVGIEQTFRPCVMATKPGGKIVLVGMGQYVVSLPSMNLITRELEILGSFKIINTYPLAVDMVASGRVNLKPLVTHHFKLSELKDALELMCTNKEPFIKVLIHLNPFWNSGCPKL